MKNSKREILLSALILHPTVREAAAAAGIPETTAYTWLRKPDFNAEYKRRKKQLVTEASDNIILKMNEATRVIKEIMRDTDAPPQTRLNAAKTVLEFAFKLIEQNEIMTRVEALEAAIMDGNG